MYMVAGHVTEILGGDTWDNLLVSRVLEPLGMSAARIIKSKTDVLAADAAKPYIYTNELFVEGDADIYV